MTLLELRLRILSAINANEIKVTFNKAVTKETANEIANYSVELNANPVATDLRVALQADGKTAIIRNAGAYTVGDKIVVQVKDGIKDAEGNAVERFTSATETYLLADAPQFVGAEFVPAGNAGILEVTFDRPVTNVGTTLVKIDGLALADKGASAFEQPLGTATVAAPGNYTYNVAIAAGDEFKTASKVGSHEVVIFDVAETARANAKVNSVINTTYTVTADVTAPEVVGITAVNANKFFVEFTENIKLDTDLSKSITVKKGNLTFPTKSTGDAGLTSAHGSTDAFTFVSAPTRNAAGKPGVYVVVNDTNTVGTSNPLFDENKTSANLDVTVENYKDAVDLLGTKYNGSVTLTKGTATPVATKSVVNAAKELEVLFDSTLEVAPVAANLVVRDKDGVIIPVGDVTLVSLGNAIEGDVSVYTNRVVSIVLASKYQDKGPYTVTFKKDAVKYDIVDNKIEGYSIENNGNKAFDYVVGTAADNNFKYQVLPAGSASIVGGGDTNVIKVAYPADMGNSARDVANYTLDGKALPADTKVDFYEDKKTVHITLPKETVKATTDYKLTVNPAVQTATGQSIVKDLQSLTAYEQTIGLTDNTRPVIESAEYLVGSTNDTTSDQVILKFSENVTADKEILGTDFSVVVNGNTIAVERVQNNEQNDEYVILSLGTSVSVSQSATVSVKTDVVRDEDSIITDLTTPTALHLNASSVTASTKTLDAQGNAVALADAPIGVAGGVGQITGTTTAMEYRKVGDTNWTAATATNTAVTPGNYEVRTAATNVAPATAATTVTVTAAAPALVATATAGTAVDTTKVTATATGANTLAYKVSNATIATPNVGDAVTGTTAYTSGDDITGVDATTNKYLGVYELDGSNEVVSFKEIVLTATEIAAYATAPTTIKLEAGSATAATVTADVGTVLPGATDTTGSVTGWATGTAETVKFTVTDATSASTITINGVAYTSGDDYTIGAATPLTIVVTTTEAGKITAVRTFTVTVAS